MGTRRAAVLAITCCLFLAGLLAWSTPTIEHRTQLGGAIVKHVRHGISEPGQIRVTLATAPTAHTGEDGLIVVAAATVAALLLLGRRRDLRTAPTTLVTASHPGRGPPTNR